MLAGRGSIISVDPSTTVFEALQRMSDRNVGAVLVIRYLRAR